MKRMAFLFAALAVIIGLSGCDYLLGQKNLFADLEGNSTQKYSSMAPSDTLAALGRDTDSPSFYEDLTVDTTTRDAILDDLNTIIADPASSDSDVQTAATYSAEIILNTTETGDVVNSLADGIIDTANSGDSMTPESLVSSFIAPAGDVLDTQEEFSNFIQDMRDLKATFDALAGAVDPSVVSVDGNIAQAAVVAYALVSIVDASPGADDAAKAESLRSVLSSLLDPNIPDQTLILTGSPLTEIVADGTSLFTILAAAGLSSLSSLLSGI
ncbi:MAG: hypothetical protein WCT14_20930 [Treponemataceae bacterium]